MKSINLPSLYLSQSAFTKPPFFPFDSTLKALNAAFEFIGTDKIEFATIRLINEIQASKMTDKNNVIACALWGFTIEVSNIDIDEQDELFRLQVEKWLSIDNQKTNQEIYEVWKPHVSEHSTWKKVLTVNYDD